MIFRPNLQLYYIVKKLRVKLTLSEDIYYISQHSLNVS